MFLKVVQRQLQIATIYSFRFFIQQHNSSCHSIQRQSICFAEGNANNSRYFTTAVILRTNKLYYIVPIANHFRKDKLSHRLLRFLNAKITRVAFQPALENTYSRVNSYGARSLGKFHEIT